MGIYERRGAASYRDHFSYIKDQPNELIPSAAVGPNTVEQVQAIVRTANQYKIPLYAISTGKNFAYGGPSPNVRGSVTVDLKRMNRVLEVNDKRYYALVEPGVSYIDLYRYIQEHGLKVWVDTPDPGWGSPIGNRSITASVTRWASIATISARTAAWRWCCRTARSCAPAWARCPASKSWKEYKHGYGPDPAGLFGQGNFGIVTKMGFRLMPQPEHWRNGAVTVPKRQDLIPLVDDGQLPHGSRDHRRAVVRQRRWRR